MHWLSTTLSALKLCRTRNFVNTCTFMYTWLLVCTNTYLTQPYSQCVFVLLRIVDCSWYYGASCKMDALFRPGRYVQGSIWSTICSFVQNECVIWDSSLCFYCLSWFVIKQTMLVHNWSQVCGLQEQWRKWRKDRRKWKRTSGSYLKGLLQKVRSLYFELLQ